MQVSRPDYFPIPSPSEHGTRVKSRGLAVHVPAHPERQLVSVARCALTRWLPSRVWSMTREKGGEDVLKTDHLYDDIGDELRYGLQDMLNSAAKPREIQLAEEIALVERRDPIEAHFMRLRETEDRKKRR